MPAEAARTTLAELAGPPPGPRGTPLLGNLRELERAPLAYLSRLHADYGDVVRFRAFRIPVTLLVHPDHVQHVLQIRHTVYDKETWDFRTLRPVLGESLLTTDGPPWLRRRRLMQPAFHRDRIAGFAAVMRDAAARTSASRSRSRRRRWCSRRSRSAGGRRSYPDTSPCRTPSSRSGPAAAYRWSSSRDGESYLVMCDVTRVVGVRPSVERLAQAPCAPPSRARSAGFSKVFC